MIEKTINLRSYDLLQVLITIQSQYITDVDPRVLFEQLLNNLLGLTQSEYGFIGEVLHGPSGSPYLKTFAITNIAWDEGTQAFYDEHRRTGMEFNNLETLFGQVMKTGEPVISNCPSEDTRRGGLPAGHPQLNAFLGVPFFMGGELVGMAGIANRPAGYNNVVVDYLRPFLAVCGSIIAAYRNDLRRKKAEAALEQSLDKIKTILGATVQSIVAVIESKDHYTAGHQRRVANLARAIATEMGLTTDQIEGVSMAGTIHDLGKISIPTEILSKPTKLSGIEFSLIKTHSQNGYDILKGIDFPWPVARIVLEHHEKMNGSGYPQGLSGDELLIESRIIAVADVIEAIAFYRPYRPALGISKALDEIANDKGILFDREVVAACLRLFKQKGFKMEG